MDGFSAKQTEHLTGVAYRTLDHWAKTGLIVPEVAQAEGTGSKRLWSFANLIELRTARILRDAGVSVQALRKVVAHLRQRDGRTTPLAGTFLVAVGNDVVEVQGDDLVSLLRQPGQVALRLVLDVGHVVTELRREAAQLQESA